MPRAAAWRVGGGIGDASYVLYVEQSFLDDFSAYYLYDLFQALAANAGGYLDLMAQYGVRSLSYGGYAAVAPHAWQTPEQQPGSPQTINVYLTEDPPSAGTCAWHTADARGYPYAVLFRPVAGFGCIPPGWTELMALCSIASHELSEALSDPVPGGGTIDLLPPVGAVLGQSGQEIGDVSPCVWQLTQVPALDGRTLWSQQIYDAEHDACWDPLPLAARPAAGVPWPDPGVGFTLYADVSQPPPDWPTVQSLTFGLRLSGWLVRCNDRATYEAWSTLGQPATARMSYLVNGYLDMSVVDPSEWPGLIASVAPYVAGSLRLDIETGSPTLDDLNAAIDAAYRSFNRVIVYTSAGFWQSIGNPQIGGRCELWLADWRTPIASFNAWFGGWTRASMVQYAADLEASGVTLDLSASEGF